MKLTIKESFKEERSELETIFEFVPKLRGIDWEPDEVNNIMYLCDGEHNEHGRLFYFVPKYERKSFEKLAGKLGFQV